MEMKNTYMNHSWTIPSFWGIKHLIASKSRKPMGQVGHLLFQLSWIFWIGSLPSYSLQLWVSKPGHYTRKSHQARSLKQPTFMCFLRLLWYDHAPLLQVNTRTWNHARTVLACYRYPFRNNKHLTKGLGESINFNSTWWRTLTLRKYIDPFLIFHFYVRSPDAMLRNVSTNLLIKMFT